MSCSKCNNTAFFNVKHSALCTNCKKVMKKAETIDMQLVCPNCGKEPLSHSYTAAGTNEVFISGLCEPCFDSITAPPEDEEEIEDPSAF